MGSSLLLKGGTNTPRSIVESFSLANAFVPGDAIRYDIPSSTWVKAQADSAENSEVAGIVSAASFNTFDLTYSGYIQVSALSGVSAPVLFLDSTIAGGLTTSPPSAIGTVIKPVLTKTTNGSGYIVTNYLGTQIGGSSTVAIDEIQPVGTVVPFAGSTIPDSWLECNGNSYAVSAYPNLYAKLQYSGGDRQPAYGSVCTLNMNSASNAITSSAAANVGNIAYINNRTSTASGATPTYLAHDFVAQIVGKADNTLYIQILPKYNSTTKSFSYPNTTINGADFTGGLYSTLSLYSSLTSTTNLSAAALINASTLTHFNTPDLRGRFAIGANTTAISELETDVANNSAISAIYSLGSEGGEEKNSLPTINATVGGGSANGLANVANNLLNNIPPYTVVRYIIKATPYTRAAIIDGIDIPYTSLLVGDLRDGSLRPGGSGEDLLFKTNNGTSGTERMRLTNAGRLGIASTTPPTQLHVIASGVPHIGFGSASAYGTIGVDGSNNSVYNAWSGHVWQNGGTEKLRLSATGQLNIPSTATSTSVNTGGLTLGGGLGMALNLTVGGGISAAGGITFSGLTRVTNNTPSTATNIGALTVAGGVGIAGALYVGAIQTQTLNAASNATSNNTATGALTVVGGAGIGGALNVGGGISAAGSLNVVGGISAGGALTVGGGITAATLDCSGQVKSGSIRTGTFTATSLAASATTTSTTTGTGALVVAGGAGIGGALNVGGGITAARLDLGSGAIKTTGTIVSGSITSSGTFTATSLNASANTPSTNTTTGALVVVGGAGIAGALHVGGGISAAGGITFSNLTRVTNTTASTSTTTGALTVAGGAGIAGALYVGGITTAGGITMGGALTVGGAARVNSTAASTSTTTGALTVAGGLGVAGALNVGGGISAVGGITLGTSQLAVPTGTAPIFGARAWGLATINSLTSVSLTSAGNIASVSISGTQLTFTFNTATQMPDTNYAVSIMGSSTGGGSFVYKVKSQSVGSFTIEVNKRADNANAFGSGECQKVYVVVHR